MSVFSKFVGRYAGELRGMASLLNTLFRALPIDPADKSQAVKVLDDLNSAADRIEAGLSDILADGVINRDDLKIVVREVVAEILPDILGGAVETQARTATKPARVRKPRARKPTGE